MFPLYHNKLREIKLVVVVVIACGNDHHYDATRAIAYCLNWQAKLQMQHISAAN